MRKNKTLGLLLTTCSFAATPVWAATSSMPVEVDDGKVEGLTYVSALHPEYQKEIIDFCRHYNLSSEVINSDDLIFTYMSISGGNCKLDILDSFLSIYINKVENFDVLKNNLNTSDLFGVFSVLKNIVIPEQQRRFMEFFKGMSTHKDREMALRVIRRTYTPEKLTALDEIVKNLSTSITRLDHVSAVSSGLSADRYVRLLPYLSSEMTFIDLSEFTEDQFSLCLSFLQNRTEKTSFFDIRKAVFLELTLEQFIQFTQLVENNNGGMFHRDILLIAKYGLTLEHLTSINENIKSKSLMNIETAIKRISEYNIAPNQINSMNFTVPYIGIINDYTILFELYELCRINSVELEQEILRMMDSEDPNTVERVSKFIIGYYRKLGLTFYHPLPLKAIDKMQNVLLESSVRVELEQEILRTLDSEDLSTVERVSKFMIKNYRKLGLQLNHPLLQKAIDKMQNVLLESSDRAVLERVCAFLLDSGAFDVNFDNLGFTEDHELIQTAIRQRFVLSQDLTDPTNPWKVWGDMLAKRDVDLNLSDLVPAPQPFAGKLVRLNAPAIADYAKDVAIVEASVPPIAPTALADLLGALAGRLNDGLHSTINDMTTKSFAEIRTNALGDGVSFLTNLLRTPKIGLLDAQFKCVMANVMSFPNDDGAEDTLSSQEEKLLKVLIGIAGCPTGQGGGVEAAYLNLPPQFKFETNRGLHGGLLAEQRKGKAFLMDLIKEASLTLLTNDNPFMRDITQEHEGNPIAELVHQGKYMINFIGDMVGINHPVTFNHHAGLFYQNMLALSKEETLRKFYDFAMADNKMVLFVKQKIQEMVDNRVGFEAFTSLKGDLTYKQMWGIKADSFKAPKLTDAGVLQLLLSINALQVIDSELPWGAPIPASSLPPVSSL